MTDRALRLLAGFVCVALLVACGAGSDSATDKPAGEGSTTETLVAHCAKVVRVEGDETVTPLEADGMTLPAVDFVAAEPSGTVLVLLHQLGVEGLCGWATFAPQAAAAGFSSVAFDMCAYGGSTCADGEGTPPEDQVALAVTHARDELGAEHVVLVGASMGGSQTVVSVARGAAVDGWVDLSGADTWDGTRLLDVADAVRSRALPGLVVHAPDDGDEEYAAAQALAGATGARFLDGGSGHGWAMLDDHAGALLPAGRSVLDFLGSSFPG